MEHLPCLRNAFTLSRFWFLISRVSFEKSLLIYLPNRFGRLHLLTFSVYLYSWLILLQLYVSLNFWIAYPMCPFNFHIFQSWMV